MEVERNTEDPCKSPVPEGLQQHLNKMFRAVLLSRPVHLNRFFAEYFETELDRRTLSDLQFSDVFIRIEPEISEPQKRGKSPDKSFTKPSAAPAMKQPKEKIQYEGPKARTPSETEEMKQMSGDDLDSEFYVDYYLTHEADDASFDYGQSDAEYHEGHAFGDDDQMDVKRDSTYYMDYFLTHETIKRKTVKPHTEKYVQDAFVPVDYDTDNFVDYFLTHETDPKISSFDQSDRDYNKAYCVPFQDVSRRDSEYCRDYFLTCEAATEEKTCVVPVTDYSGDNFVDYFLTHETDPSICGLDQPDRDYNKAYCVPFQDVSRRDSEYCRDYFLTCRATTEEKTCLVPVTDYSGDNFVDYFLMHETDPSICGLDQPDRDYNRAYCLPFQDASRRDSKYCMDYFLTCEATEGKTFVSEPTTALPLSKEFKKDQYALGEEAEEHHEQQEQDDSAAASFVFTTFPSKEAFGEQEELREPETEGQEIGREDVQQSTEDLITVEEATSKSKDQEAEEIEENIPQDNAATDVALDVPDTCSRLISGEQELPSVQSNVMVYKKWGDGFFVRSMMSDDAKIVENWYNRICPTGNDLEIALDISDPSGKFFFIGELNGEVIASLAVVPVCDDDGGGVILYCSCFYVEEQYRKCGYGRRIVDEVATETVGDAAVVALDSHEELEEMLKRGCSSTFHVTLYEGRVESAMDHRSDATVETLDLESDFESLVAYDDGCFIRPGSQQRRRLLERWTTIPGGKTVVAFRGTGDDGDDQRRIVGFGCRRPSFQSDNHLIGPLYADDAGVAWDIVGCLVSDIDGQKIWINICETNTEAVGLITDLRLEDSLHMIRMYKNGDPGPMSDKVFAITSIDICGF